MKRIKAFWAEISARRAGSKFSPRGIGRAARHIVGPTGYAFSSHWDELSKHHDVYNQSFDRRVPPSLHIAQQNGRRPGSVMPLSERCIEDWDRDHNRSKQ